jgi:hypothetical protein
MIMLISSASSDNTDKPKWIWGVKRVFSDKYNPCILTCFRNTEPVGHSNTWVAKMPLIENFTTFSTKAIAKISLLEATKLQTFRVRGYFQVLYRTKMQERKRDFS